MTLSSGDSGLLSEGTWGDLVEVTRAVVLILGIGATLLGGTAFAQVALLGGEFQLNSYTTYAQSNPALAVGSQGEYLLVWGSYGSTGNDDIESSIQLRRFDSDGSPFTAEFQVNTYTTNAQGAPSVAAGPDGRFLVVWTSNGSTGTDLESSIQGQRYELDGTPLGSEFQVNTYTTSYQYSGRVVASPQGAGFVVVWSSQGSYGTDDSISSVQAQRLDAEGLPVGTQFQVNTYTTRAQRDPDAAFTPKGEIVVVWESDGSTGADDDGTSIQGRRFDANGSPLGAEFQINTATTSSQIFPAVSVDSEGNFVVVWESLSPGTTLGRGPISINGQRFASDGSRMGNEFRLADSVADELGPLSVVTIPPDDMLVAWERAESGVPANGNRNIHARRFRSDGTPTSEIFQVNSYTTGDQYRPALAKGAEGEFVVVWQSYGSFGSDNSDFSIQGQRLSTMPRCGQPWTTGASPVASDALWILQAGVGVAECASCVCDVDSSGTIAATDALRVLQKAVGIGEPLQCPATCSTTTTTVRSDCFEDVDCEGDPRGPHCCAYNCAECNRAEDCSVGYSCGGCRCIPTP